MSYLSSSGRSMDLMPRMFALTAACPLQGTTLPGTAGRRKTTSFCMQNQNNPIWAMLQLIVALKAVS